jgi:SpoVK/Ycf46/Vps4 family AAA+-type ATPase
LRTVPLGEEKKDDTKRNTDTSSSTEAAALLPSARVAKDIAAKTAGLTGGELLGLVGDASRAMLRRYQVSTSSGWSTLEARIDVDAVGITDAIEQQRINEITNKEVAERKQKADNEEKEKEIAEEKARNDDFERERAQHATSHALAASTTLYRNGHDGIGGDDSDDSLDDYSDDGMIGDLPYEENVQRIVESRRADRARARRDEKVRRSRRVTIEEVAQAMGDDTVLPPIDDDVLLRSFYEAEPESKPIPSPSTLFGSIPTASDTKEAAAPLPSPTSTLTSSPIADTTTSSTTKSLSLTMADFDAALAALAERSSASAGTLAKVPNVKWDDVGGLEHVKREIMDTIELPLHHPELFASGMH